MIANKLVTETLLEITVTIIILVDISAQVGIHCEGNTEDSEVAPVTR